jgi:hypothetical protein
MLLDCKGRLCETEAKFLTLTVEILVSGIP